MDGHLAYIQEIAGSTPATPIDYPRARSVLGGCKPPAGRCNSCRIDFGYGEYPRILLVSTERLIRQRPVYTYMPLVRTSCECCGRQQYECPNCGSWKVTPLDNPQQKSPSDLAILGPGPFTDSDETYHNVCWDCGWMEEVSVSVSWEVTDRGTQDPGIL